MKYQGWYHPSRFASRWKWAYHSWNFVNSRYLREAGVRIFGFEWVGLSEIPMGELRF